MRPRWHAPVDPECPIVRKYIDTLLNDPLTEAYGAPVNEIVAAFEDKHRPHCKRCAEYGAANIEVD